ncbi:hypothetical protein C8R44DRAFT_731120 [Mycena epipterygia]|nr:hypothetical protein C8R44DRAFT_731120 [Mycena epipterygia]
MVSRFAVVIAEELKQGYGRENVEATEGYGGLMRNRRRNQRVKALFSAGYPKESTTATRVSAGQIALLAEDFERLMQHGDQGEMSEKAVGRRLFRYRSRPVTGGLKHKQHVRRAEASYIRASSLARWALSGNASSGGKAENLEYGKERHLSLMEAMKSKYSSAERRKNIPLALIPTSAGAPQLDRNARIRSSGGEEDVFAAAGFGAGEYLRGGRVTSKEQQGLSREPLKYSQRDRKLKLRTEGRSEQYGLHLVHVLPPVLERAREHTMFRMQECIARSVVNGSGYLPRT